MVTEDIEDYQDDRAEYEKTLPHDKRANHQSCLFVHELDNEPNDAGKDSGYQATDEAKQAADRVESTLEPLRRPVLLEPPWEQSEVAGASRFDVLTAHCVTQTVE